MMTGRLITAAIFSAVLFGAAGLFCWSANASKAYEWQNAAVSGKGCFPGNCAKGKFPMAVIPLVGFDGKLYGIGDREIWISGDGLDWNSEPKTDWGERYGMRFAFFAGKFWMLGGMKSWDDFRNDVWTSGDGRNWKQLVSNAPWSPRRGHALVVFKSKLWMTGGAESSGRPDKLPVRFLNDVWSSDDGRSWTRVTANAPWSARSEHTTLVFNDKLWVIGGKERDVWASRDGRDWVRVTDKAEWGARVGNGGLVFDGRMWIFGGMDLNDVWNSADGKTWKPVFENAPWSARSAAASIVFDDKLWIYSGKTGREDSWSGDIWTMSRKTD
jgi:hypothetical protein